MKFHDEDEAVADEPGAGARIHEPPAENLEPDENEGVTEAVVLERLLSRIPEDQRPRYESMAVRAAGGSRAAAIRLACLGCVAWQPSEVRRCHLIHCPLWRFRGVPWEGN